MEYFASFRVVDKRTHGDQSLGYVEAGIASFKSSTTVASSVQLPSVDQIRCKLPARYREKDFDVVVTEKDGAYTSVMKLRERFPDTMPASFLHIEL